MVVTASMTNEEEKFVAERWWAKHPGFVIETLRRQLTAASAIWPELEGVQIVLPQPVTKPESE